MGVTKLKPSLNEDYNVKHANVLHVLFAITAFLEFNPYFIWHDNRILYYGIATLTIFAFGITVINNDIRMDRIGVKMSFVAALIILYYYNTGTINTLETLLRSIPFYLFLALLGKDKRKVFQILSYIFAITIIPTLILYLIHQMGINPEWEYLVPANPLKAAKGVYYKQFLGSVKIAYSYSKPLSGLYRAQGMFDEPGLLGTVAALILIADGYKLKNNFKNIVIMIGGLISFSFAFYVLSVVYLGLKHTYKFIPILIVFLILASLFNMGILEDPFLEKYIFNRFKIEDGSFAGDNRTTRNFDIEFNNFLHSDISTILFGKGAGAGKRNPAMQGSSSWKMSLYNRGILGLLMLILFPIIGTIVFSKTKEGYYLLFMFLLSVYQRPNILNLGYMSILFGGLSNLNGYLKVKKQAKESGNVNF